MVDVEQLWALDDDAGPFWVLVQCQLQEVPAVCGLELVDLPCGDQSLPGELPDGLQEVVPRPGSVVIDQQQGLVDQSAEEVQDGAGGDPLVRAYLFGRGQ